MKRVLLAVALLTGVLLNQGCSSGGNAQGGSPAPAASLPPPSVTATPSVSNLNDVGLPLDRYVTTVDDYVDLDYASRLMTADCMKGFGITWNPGTRLSMNGLRDRTNRLGLVDEAVAKRAGYHIDPAHAGDYAEQDQRHNPELSDDQNIILMGARPGQKAPKGVPQGGCTGEGYRRIGWSIDEDQWLQDLTNDAAQRTFADKRALKVSEAWSACMKESGYRYDKPDDANNDLRWWSDDKAPASKAEINTAVADVRCKKKVHYLDQMTAILAAYQQQVVETNAERLEAVHQHTQDALKKAAAVLGGR
nr:hypothetical protein [uncultured Actinoplanes sp.]